MCEYISPSRSVRESNVSVHSRRPHLRSPRQGTALTRPLSGSTSVYAAHAIYFLNNQVSATRADVMFEHFMLLPMFFVSHF
jgi:hypothetical protein